MTLKISHSHAIESHDPHHHHHVQDHHENQAVDPQADVQPHDSQDSEHHHTHEILITENAFCPSTPQALVLRQTHIEASYPVPVDQHPPREPALNSIFRPPIA